MFILDGSKSTFFFSREQEKSIHPCMHGIHSVPLYLDHFVIYRISRDEMFFAIRSNVKYTETRLNNIST